MTIMAFQAAFVAKGSLKTLLASIRAGGQAALFYRRENHH